MAARKNSTKRKMSVAANSAVSQNNIVECSEEMADIIKRIVVREGEDTEVVDRVNRASNEGSRRFYNQGGGPY